MVRTQTKKPLSTHVALGVAEVICVSAFALELSRALSGNTLSWAYVFEWPILGGYAVFMWRRLLREDPPANPLVDGDDYDDAKLAAYNDYLARVHRQASVDRVQGQKG
jgi:hypothetical protein